MTNEELLKALEANLMASNDTSETLTYHRDSEGCLVATELDEMGNFVAQYTVSACLTKRNS